jgi:hypothetical protein
MFLYQPSAVAFATALMSDLSIEGPAEGTILFLILLQKSQFFGYSRAKAQAKIARLSNYLAAYSQLVQLALRVL